MKVGDLVRWYCRNPQTKELYFGLVLTVNNKQKIDMLNNNQIPFFEPGLKELVSKNYYSERAVGKTIKECIIDRI